MKLSTNKLLFIFGLIGWVGLAMSLTTCSKEDVSTPTSSVEMSSRNNAGNAPQDSFKCRIVRWGKLLLPVNQASIIKGNYKGQDYWQVKVKADTAVIPPTKYVANPIRERVMLADTALVTSLDSFYICRLERI